VNETEAIIERIRQVNSRIQHLEVAIDESLKRIKPGQSLLARLHEKVWHPYLREHWWPVDIKGSKLLIERPADQHYEAGQVVSVIGLVGQPYRFRRSLRNVLLMAYDTFPTALLMNIPWLLSNNISVTLVLLGTAKEYDTTHLNPEVEIVHGDEEITWPDQVMTVGWADQVFVVVAQDDEIGRFSRIVTRFGELRADLPKSYLFGVFRPFIPCGTGACYSCMLQMRKGTQLVCTDGPSFDLTQVAT